MDATTYLTGPLPQYITRNDFFVYRNGWMDMEMINMGSWLMYAKTTNNSLLSIRQCVLLLILLFPVTSILKVYIGPLNLIVTTVTVLFIIHECFEYIRVRNI